MLKIIPLGGLGEIGLNMMVVESHQAMFVVDAGLMFPEDYMLGVDIVIPDMEYIKRHRSKMVGIVLTHAHEDHIGALPYLLREVNVPIYGTPFTLETVRCKLDEFDMAPSMQLQKISPGTPLQLAGFELDFIRVGHSVLDGVGLAIVTSEGVILHTGDFKISHASAAGMQTQLSKFALYGEKGVLALLSDSTNVEREGYTISDQQIGAKLAQLISSAKGRVIIALFASNIQRIQQIVNIADAKGSKLVINGRSIEISVQIAQRLGYLHMPANMQIDIQNINDYPDNEVVMVTTGSQGEPMSALARMASGTHKQISIKPQDTIILSSKFIPGNEKAIANIINNLYRRGADVIYEKISDIHVSGHAFQEELKMMISLTQPRFFVPIHGELRHLTLHARLAEQVGIPRERILLVENGQTIAFDNDSASILERVYTGRVLIDGKGVGDVGRSVLKERRVLSEEGLVVVNMAFDEETGIVVYGPELVSRGFVFETETGHLLEDAKCVILEIVEELAPETNDRLETIRKRVQAALRKYFFFTIGRRPVILPFIIEV